MNGARSVLLLVQIEIFQHTPHNPLLVVGIVACVISWVLIEKTRTVVTDGAGQYKITTLRPGTYTVRVVSSTLPAGYVQTYDQKPRRRLWEVMKSQGLQENQQVVFLSDGGEDVRRVQAYLQPGSEH